MEISGIVIKETFGKGSKSERDAVMLDTGDSRFVLRRQTGNPFSDPVLDRLVGKTIRCEGNLTGYTFILTNWTVLHGG